MDIRVVHAHYRQDHLDRVVAQMRDMGAPVIRAAWDPTNEHWVAVEGCHRVRAAKVLGLIPTIVEIPADDTRVSAIDTGSDCDMTVAELVSDVSGTAVIGFDDL